MSRAGTRCGCGGSDRRKITSRSSKQAWNESNVFFIVLIATYKTSDSDCRTHGYDTYECATTSNVRACGSYSGKGDAAKAAVANLLHDLISLLQRRPTLRLVLRVGVHVRGCRELCQLALFLLLTEGSMHTASSVPSRWVTVFTAHLGSSQVDG